MIPGLRPTVEADGDDRGKGGASIRVVAVPRSEGFDEYVVGHLAALGDPLGLVEGPVDPQVDPALAVLLLGLGERREAAGDEGAHGPVAPPGEAIELVRDEGEGDVV